MQIMAVQRVSTCMDHAGDPSRSRWIRSIQGLLYEHRQTSCSEAGNKVGGLLYTVGNSDAKVLCNHQQLDKSGRLNLRDGAFECRCKCMNILTW